MVRIRETDSLKANEAATRVGISASAEFIQALMILDAFVEVKENIKLRK